MTQPTSVATFADDVVGAARDKDLRPIDICYVSVGTCVACDDGVVCGDYIAMSAAVLTEDQDSAAATARDVAGDGAVAKGEAVAWI